MYKIMEEASSVYLITFWSYHPYFINLIIFILFFSRPELPQMYQTIHCKTCSVYCTLKRGVARIFVLRGWSI